MNALTPWWRSEMRRIDLERTAALREAEGRFDRAVRVVADSRPVPAVSTTDVEPKRIKRTTAADEAASYLVPANLDTRPTPERPTRDDGDDCVDGGSSCGRWLR